MGAWLRKAERSDNDRVLLAGLPGCGKTAPLYRLVNIRHVPSTTNAVGFNVETTRHHGTGLSFWDVYSNDASWDAWHHYTQTVRVLVFVVDGSDRQRIDGQLDRGRSAQQELHRMLAHRGLTDAMLLVAVTKQDVRGSMSVEEVVQRLCLHRLNKPPRAWQALCCSAVTGAGVPEVLDWLVEHIADASSAQSDC